MIILLGFSIHANAQEMLCQDIFQPESNPYAAQFIKVGDLNDKEIRPFRQTITNVNSFLGELEIPKNVNITVYGIHGNPAASLHLPEINIGIRYGVSSKKRPQKIDTKNPIYSEAILAHEYGHLVFRENYRKLEPQQRNAEEAYFELIASQKESKLIAGKIEILMAKASSAQGDEKISLQKQIQDLFDEETRVQQKGLRAMEVVDQVDSVVSPYNEFFADVVAVLHTENSNAISDAVTFTSKNQMIRGQAQAKFSRDSRDFGNNIRHPKEMEAHQLFFMARAYMWSSYLASPSTMKNNKSEVLSAVFIAVAKETSRQLKNDSTTELTWKEANESLISSIEAEMKLRGIEPLK
jgi:hypothetical protein